MSSGRKQNFDALQSPSDAEQPTGEKYLCVILFLFVLVRGAHPVVIDRSQELDSDGKLVFPYRTTSVLLLTNAFLCIFYISRSCCEGGEMVKSVFFLCGSKALNLYGLFGVMYALGDYLEMQGIHGLAASGYQVLLQSKIVVVALFMIIAKRRPSESMTQLIILNQTPIQWAFLSILTLSIVSYLVPTVSSATTSSRPRSINAISTGLLLTFIRIAISSIRYVLQDKYKNELKDPKPTSNNSIARIYFSQVIVMVMLSAFAQDTWQRGFFSGWSKMTVFVLILSIAKSVVTLRIVSQLDKKVKHIAVIVTVAAVYTLDTLAIGMDIQIEACLTVSIVVVAAAAAWLSAPELEKK